MRLSYVLVLLAFLVTSTMYSAVRSSGMFKGTGSVSFVSEAPLETIQASSDDLKGVVDMSSNTFAMSFPVASFMGFNSPLQKEHFNEHYLETGLHPKATFSGKIIGWKDCDESCSMEVTAKGKMVIHGVTRIANIPVSITYSTEDKMFHAKSDFEVALKDYNIDVPLILEAKIAQVIKVHVDAQFIRSDEGK